MIAHHLITYPLITNPLIPPPLITPPLIPHFLITHFLITPASYYPSSYNPSSYIPSSYNPFSYPLLLSSPPPLSLQVYGTSSWVKPYCMRLKPLIPYIKPPLAASLINGLWRMYQARCIVNPLLQKKWHYLFDRSSG